MPYIGKEPVAGNFVLLDSITTSATATYALTKDSVAYSPESARNMIVSLNGVTQAPEAAFTVSGSNITFSSALTSSDVIDYILVLGDVLSVGTPSDGTVGTSQMSYPLDNFSSTGIDDNATSTAITIDSSENVGIGTSSIAAEARLAVDGGRVYIDADDAFGLRFLNSGTSGAFIGTSAADTLNFYNGTGTERMRIDSSGNVGIGTTSPAAKAEIYGAAASSNIALRVTNTATNGYSTVQLGDANAGIYRNGSAQSGYAGASSLNLITVGSHNIGFSTANTLRAVIAANGDVGIGASDLSVYNALGSSRDFVVKSGGTTTCTIHSGTTNYGHLAFADGTTTANDEYRGLIQYYHGDNSMRLFTNASERMRIAANGNVLIGQTAATGGANGIYLRKGVASGIIATNDNALELFRRSSDGKILRFFRDTTEGGWINVTSTSASLVSSSDVRLKENIVDAPAGNIDSIKVRSFDWKADGSHQTYGMVAQELVDVAPEAVSQGETEDDMWGVDYSKLVPMMIKEIQDLKAEVAALKGE